MRESLTAPPTQKSEAKASSSKGENLSRRPVVALAGCPNSGKTTLFNLLTGSRNRPVNYPGSTVDYALGETSEKWNERFLFVDTPGTYSLFPQSGDEEVAVNILHEIPKHGSPDVVLAVVDSSQISRHLYLVRQLLVSGFRVVVALTMSDLFDDECSFVDVDEMSAKLGCPVVVISGTRGRGIEDLLAALKKETRNEKPHVKKLLPWSPEESARVYEEVHSLVRGACKDPGNAWGKLRERTEKWDRVLLHPALGPLLFAAIMFTLFSSIFWMAGPFMDWIDTAFGYSSEWVLSVGQGALWSDLLANGILASVGAVLVFVPQVAILFFGVTLLEDSGYLARAASIVDRPLSKIGLNGRAFVPLLSGYACAIPAMMAARTIPNKKERWLTLFIIPLMSCSARLPVFALLLTFLFWGAPSWQPGLVLAGIYLASLVIGAFAAAILNRLVPSEGHSYFLMELPFYRRPNWTSVLQTVRVRTTQYIRRAGPLIFIFAVVFWVLSSFPNYSADTESERLESSYAAKLGQVIEPVMEPMGGDWRTGTALISAFTAREVFVSALAVIFQEPGVGNESMQEGILKQMTKAKTKEGNLLFTPASVIALILFFMVALQCMATVGVARKEFGNWRTALFQLTVFNLLAYVMAVSAYQCLTALGIS